MVFRSRYYWLHKLDILCLTHKIAQEELDVSNEISHEVKFLITKFELGEIFSIDFFPEVTFVKDVYIEHRFVTGDIESSV